LASALFHVPLLRQSNRVNKCLRTDCPLKGTEASEECLSELNEDNRSTCGSLNTTSSGTYTRRTSQVPILSTPRIFILNADASRATSNFRRCAVHRVFMHYLYNKKLGGSASQEPCPRGFYWHSRIFLYTRQYLRSTTFFQSSTFLENVKCAFVVMETYAPSASLFSIICGRANV